MFVRRVITFISILIGINGLAGGYAAVRQPDGPFGIPTAVLKNGPFNSFLIPGITLFVIIGIGHLINAYFLIKKFRAHEYVLGIMSAVTMGWIGIQIYVMEEINALHVVIFLLGLFQAAYSVYLLMKGDKFPFNVL